MRFRTLLLLLLAVPLYSQAPLRLSIPLAENWKFTKGNPGSAAAPGFDDSAWQTVRVPHDWAIAGPFNPAGSAETGKLPWQGEGWYRCRFRAGDGWAGKRVYALFDGVMAFPKVYLNGRLAGSWDYGYNSFFIDLTPLLHPGADNVLAVYADTRQHDSRWYPGAGIYRKVQLIVADPVHVGVWGTQITTPEITPRHAAVQLRTTVHNEGDRTESVSVQQYILAACSGEILAADSAGCPVKPGETHTYEQRLRLPEPRLWSPETPALYTLKTVLRKGGVACDEYESTFGVRTVEFTANDGMLLNGQRVQLRGVNLHHDLGALGAAFNRRAQERQLELLRGMGCNAIRTSHNAPAPELLDLCDRMGFLVLDELFDKYDGKADYLPGADFTAFADRQVRHFVQRDRNHPCIFPLERRQRNRRRAGQRQQRLRQTASRRASLSQLRPHARRHARVRQPGRRRAAPLRLLRRDFLQLRPTLRAGPPAGAAKGRHHHRVCQHGQHPRVLRTAAARPKNRFHRRCAGQLLRPERTLVGRGA
ncbi:MAG: hypothetical protein IPH12_05645 [Saprospirales bacterium]|nr:hypothetical protein [Saprospirales bacterium]